jgi:TolB-like protein
VRRAGPRVRVTGQLVEAVGAAWACNELAVYEENLFTEQVHEG